MAGPSCGESGVGQSRVWLLHGVPLGSGLPVSGMECAEDFALFLGRLGSPSSSEPFSGATSAGREWVLRAMATSEGVSRVHAAMASEVLSLRVRQL